MDNFKAATILLVEDDLGDQKLIKTSLEQGKIANKILIANSGDQALEYLEKSKTGTNGFPFPDLILLDLNMPGMGGKEFLRIAKEDPDLSIIPIVVLTTSDAERDVLESFQLQASGYIKKAVSLEGFQEIMSHIQDYWFVICRRVEHAQESCTPAAGALG
ncbi:MAG: response regulator [Sedimentisphaerales bacterium]|nr:response regulator [Sedimentisphaerales bacterium]